MWRVDISLSRKFWLIALAAVMLFTGLMLAPTGNTIFSVAPVEAHAVCGNNYHVHATNQAGTVGYRWDMYKYKQVGPNDIKKFWRKRHFNGDAGTLGDWQYYWTIVC